MDNKNLEVKKEEEKKAGEQKTENKTDEIAKITITKDSEMRLLDLLQRVNDGFESGRVNRQSLTSWIIQHVCENADGSLVEDIRHDHFDEFMMLEAILRKGKSDGKLPSEFTNLLRGKMSSGSNVKAKNRKTLTDKYINDVFNKEDKKEDLNGTKGI